MKNRLLNIILLAVMATMINACAKTPKKPDPIPDVVEEPELMPDVEPISDPETEARKSRWSAGEMDR
ncbi:hypothetical protein [Candidatus Marithrix sp. Canyon 246]|nr:hypothetical protein [Candidatus Marithrix sp. Canyon 246]